MRGLTKRETSHPVSLPQQVSDPYPPLPCVFASLRATIRSNDLLHAGFTFRKSSILQ